MAVARLQRHAVERLELLNFLEGAFAEGGLALKGMKDDALEQIAERKVFEFSDGFEDFQHALFDSDAGLNALDDDGFAILLFSGHN